MAEVSFRYIDRVSEVISAYQHERGQLAAYPDCGPSRTRPHPARHGQPVDIDATESALGYRLRQRHIGLIAWVTRHTERQRGPDPPRSARVRPRLGCSAHLVVHCSCRGTRPSPGYGYAVSGNAVVSGERLSKAFDNGDGSARHRCWGTRTRAGRVPLNPPASGAHAGPRPRLPNPAVGCTTFADVGAVALDLHGHQRRPQLGSGACSPTSPWTTSPMLGYARRCRFSCQPGAYTITAERLVLHVEQRVSTASSKAEDALGGPISDRARTWNSHCVLANISARRSCDPYADDLSVRCVVGCRRAALPHLLPSNPDGGGSGPVAGQRSLRSRHRPGRTPRSSASSTVMSLAVPTCASMLKSDSCLPSWRS